MAKVISALKKPSAEFWVMVIALFCALRGAEKLADGAGLLLVGLLLFWDVTRSNRPQK